MYSFSYMEPVCCSMSSSNCCFLTCIQVSQKAGQVVWYSHLFQNFPQFIVIHTVKGFGIVNKAEIDVFLELSSFFDDPVDIGNSISGFSAKIPVVTIVWLKCLSYLAAFPYLSSIVRLYSLFSYQYASCPNTWIFASSSCFLTTTHHAIIRCDCILYYPRKYSLS